MKKYQFVGCEDPPTQEEWQLIWHENTANVKYLKGRIKQLEDEVLELQIELNR